MDSGQTLLVRAAMLSGKIRIPSGPYTGWNYAQLSFVGGGSQTTSDGQVYNIYLDPRMKH